MTHLERTPYTNRLRFIAMGPEEEMRLGESTYLSILSSSPVLPSDDKTSLYVNSIGKSIARQVKSTRPDLIKGFQWRFSVIDDPYTCNAMCMPGGKVVVYSGLINLSTRDELAAVLSHEIAHAVCRHSAEKISFMKLLLILQGVVNLIFDFGGFTHLAGHFLGSLPYSRKLELEADEVGLQLMVNSCYNPRCAISVFEKLEAQETQAEDSGKKPSKTANLLSTHPMFSDRILRMNKKIDGFNPAEYELKCGKRFDEWNKSLDEWRFAGRQWSSA